MKCHALWPLLLTLGIGSAGAAPIYRCGNTYSQTPCPQGKIVEATDTRTAAQRAEADRIAEADRKAAADLERARKQREAEAPPAPAKRAASAPLEEAPWVVGEPEGRRRLDRDRPPGNVPRPTPLPVRPAPR